MAMWEREARWHVGTLARWHVGTKGTTFGFSCPSCPSCQRAYVLSIAPRLFLQNRNLAGMIRVVLCDAGEQTGARDRLGVRRARCTFGRVKRVVIERLRGAHEQVASVKQLLKRVFPAVPVELVADVRP